MMTWLRRLNVLDRVAVAYTVVYIVCLSARAAGIHVPVVLDVAFYPLGLAVAWANWRNSTLEGIDSRSRLAWRLLAVAAIVLWVTGSIWTLWITLLGPSPYAEWIDRLAFLQYVLAIAGYLCFPRRPLPRRNLWRFALDVGMVAIAGYMVAFYVGLRLLRHGQTDLMPAVILESALDWALFVAVTVGWIEKRERIVRRALVLLLGATLVSLAGNYVMAILPAYRNGHPVDGLWFAAWALRWAAARMVWHHYRAGRAAEPDAQVDEYRGNPFAYLLVGVSFVLLSAQMVSTDRAQSPALAAAAMAMGALLVLRQFAELEESRRLFRTQVERESRFTSLVSNSSDVVIVIDAVGRVTYVSPSLGRVFGTAARLEPGMHLGDVLSPDDAKAVSALLTGGSPTRLPRFESRVQVSPGCWREIEAVWTDLRRDPAVNGVVVNCRDVTDRNEIERHLRHAQRLDAMGHMAGGLAHDLNNVLSVIRGYSELLRSEMDDSSPVAADIDQMLGAVDRAAAVTRKVLAFSRKQPGRRSLLDLNSVMQELTPMLRHLMKDQVQVRLALGPGLWPVIADQGQIEQVLVNLATNARDAMPQGGLIEIATANRAVAGDAGGPRTLRPGDYVSVAVRDQGVGMQPSVVAHIFEPFFTTKPKERGLGLGLSIVHGIVTDMEGRVLVDSVEGHGSMFTILLPRAQVSVGAEGPAA